MSNVNARGYGSPYEKPLEFEYRNLVFRKDSDKWHCFYTYDCPNACQIHAAELTIDKPHLDFMPVMWRLDVHKYEVLDTD